MQVFDPTQGFNAFTAGAQLGGNIRQRQTEAKLAPMVASGDYQGAAQYAAQRGDLPSAELYRTQYGEQLKSMKAEELAAAQKRAETLARTAAGLRNVPYEQRRAQLQQQMPILQQMGLSPEQIAQFDPTDEGINAVLAQVTPLADLLKSPEYFAPTEIMTEDGPQLAQFSSSGVAPRTYQGMAPYEAPKDPEWAYEQIGEEIFAIDKRDPNNRVSIGRAPAKQPLVKLDLGKGENKFQEGLGTQAADNYGTIVEQGRAAAASIGNLDTMDALLDQIDYTGFGGDTLLQVQRAGAMLGFDIPDLPAKEAAKRLSSQMALSLKSDLPGPMSNADREFLLSIPPNLNSTQAGNDAILFILRKREERKLDMMQSLLQANPRDMEEYRAWENRYLQETPPMFTPQAQASLLGALRGAQ